MAERSRRSRQPARAEPAPPAPTGEEQPGEEQPDELEALAAYQPGDQVILQARPGCWNYTFGPAFVYEGPRSIDELLTVGEPVVLVCDHIPFDELQKIDTGRVRGFIFEGGSAMDDEFYNYLQNENRAAVLACRAACYFARESGWVIVDGVQGMVCFNPTEETIASFQKVRAKGPPKRERMDQVVDTLRDMVEDAVRDREQAKADGTYKEPPDHKMSPSEATKAQEETSLVLQLLSGLPIKGAPGAEEAGYKPEDDAPPEGASPSARRKR